MRKLSSLLVTTAFLALVATPTFAQDWHEHGHGDFHGYYGDHNFDHWRGGSWYNGFHDGRNGWWWIVDGSWYFYPAPIYPYPDPSTPPTVVVEQAPGAAPSSYYFSNPAGYYPYVAECAGPWERVVPGSAPTTVVVQTPSTTSAVAISSHDLDYQKLNAYADEFAHININDPHALTKLRDLGKHVEAFRKSLFDRDYNAMDTLKNTEDLEHRIAAQREKLLHPTSAQPSASPSSTPPAP